MGQPRAILFDAVGTLMRPEPSVSGAYTAVARRHGIELDQAEVERRFRRAFARQDAIDLAERDNRTDQERERQRWRGIVEDVFGPIPQIEEIFLDLWGHFANARNWRLFDDVADVWRRLTEAGMTIGIASNFDDRLAGVCRELPPLDDEPHLFVSSQVGWRKPSRGFFAAIESSLSLRPEELLLVGDDLTNDLQAAQAAGWQAILLNRSELGGGALAPDSIGTLAGLLDRISPV
ncbi:MAG TPA: HAD-IA family hydrolase [Pirellulales bacterium]|jgi:putative hydrolase of the HAD superfamily